VPPDSVTYSDDPAVIPGLINMSKKLWKIPSFKNGKSTTVFLWAMLKIAMLNYQRVL
jgi:hypothetical protein